MLMADNNSLGDFCFEDDDEASDRLCFDIDSLWDEIDDQVLLIFDFFAIVCVCVRLIMCEPHGTVLG